MYSKILKNKVETSWWLIMMNILMIKIWINREFSYTTLALILQEVLHSNVYEPWTQCCTLVCCSPPLLTETLPKNTSLKNPTQNMSLILTQFLSAMFKCQIIILWRSVAWIFNLDILSMYYWISVWSSKISKTKKSFEKTKRISSKIGTKEERPNITMGQNRIMIRVILSKMFFLWTLYQNHASNPNSDYTDCTKSAGQKQ